MKKWYKIVETIAVITVLAFCICTGYFVKSQSKDVHFSKIPFSIEYGGIAEKTRLFHIQSAIVLEGKTYIVLDENGRVWQWREGETKEDAKAVLEAETVLKIMDVGEKAVYALTESGDVYAWGSNWARMINPYEEWEEYQDPMKLESLSDVVYMDAGGVVGKAFAVDSAGQLFAWGLGRYSSSKQDCTPNLFQGYQDLIGKVDEIYMGGRTFHYFKREDGSFFSIMTADYNGLGDFIFPNFPGQEPVVDLYNNANIFDIREEGEDKAAFLYEMGKNDSIKLLAADGYTMYLYRNDNTLWYWNSERITYHNNEWAGASVEKKDFNHSGFFEKVNLEEVLGIEGDMPEIIQICSSEDRALFLLEDGRVFESKYVTAEVKDVEYYAFDMLPSFRGSSENTGIIYRMRLKELAFQKLEYENIVNIASNKSLGFYLVDKSGNIYCYYPDLDRQW